MTFLELVVSSRITKEQNSILVALSKQHQITKSELIRDILNEYINQNKLPPPKFKQK